MTGLGSGSHLVLHPIRIQRKFGKAFPLQCVCVCVCVDVCVDMSVCVCLEGAEV